MSRSLRGTTPLLAAAALSALAAWKLAGLGQTPSKPAPYYLAFLISLVMATIAGWRSRERDSSPEASSTTAYVGWGPKNSTYAAAAGLLLACTAVLQRRERPPAVIMLLWLLAMVFTVLAVPRRPPGERTQRRPSREWLSRAAAIATLLVFAAATRLVSLERNPWPFGGDEANQTVDGRDWIRGSDRTDPFGAGWYGSMRLGMLPAGAGGLAFSSRIAGPRIPYAIAGVLSVAAATVAAGLLGGFWAATFCAALLVFSPHHVHFSRIASVMILDSLFAALFIALVTSSFGRRSLRLGALAGISAGLALYGYTGGRVLAVVLFLAIAVVFLKRWPWAVRSRLGSAMAAGFIVSGGPNLLFAARRFDDWNSRFADVGLFAGTHWAEEVARTGSAAAALSDHLNRSALGLFSERSTSDWFTRTPAIGPFLLLSLSVVGLGWLVGQRRIAEAFFLALLVGGNIAGVAFTDGTPAAQRASSLVPMLAVLGGIAASAIVSKAPLPDARPWLRPTIALLAVVGVLVGTVGASPLAGQGDSDYAGYQASFARAISQFLGTRPRSETVYLYAMPDLDSGVAPLPYFLEGRRVVDVEPPKAQSALVLRPGTHIFSSRWTPSAARWALELPNTRLVTLVQGDVPDRKLGVAFVLREEARVVAVPLPE